VGLASILYVRYATPIAWTWWVLIGSAATFAAGYAASFLEPRGLVEPLAPEVSA
jgi:hypothetical protein